MAVYIYSKEQGRMVDKATGEPMVTGPWSPTVPLIVSDIEAYQSPVDGTAITSRSQEREHMARHGVIHAADKGKPRKLKNRRFIEKRGLQSLASEEVME